MILEREDNNLKFERCFQDKRDFLITIGNTSGNKPICIQIRYYGGYGFRTIIDFYNDRLIKLFKTNQMIIGA